MNYIFQARDGCDHFWPVKVCSCSLWKCLNQSLVHNEDRWMIDHNQDLQPRKVHYIRWAFNDTRIINSKQTTESQSSPKQSLNPVHYCVHMTRENTPAGSLPSPSAAWKPSSRRAFASLARAANVRGSVTAMSLRTRRFRLTLLFVRLCIRAGYFKPCSRDAAAIRVIHSVLMLRFFSFLAWVE